MQERIAKRYGTPVLNDDGTPKLNPDGTPVVIPENLIIITDADMRDADILDPEYRKSLEELGRFPNKQRVAEQQKELERLEGEARLQKALADKLVKEKNAEADAAVIETIGLAIRKFPESIQDKYAEGFKIAAANGNLIITDKNGGSEFIIDAKTGRTVQAPAAPAP